jgi:hypothetical protein
MLLPLGFDLISGPSRWRCHGANSWHPHAPLPTPARARPATRRGSKWPRDGPRPSAVRDGLFEPAHARLVQLLASLCPAAALAALREPLTARLAAHAQPSGPSDKAEHATVAEAAAGLLAAGVPFLSAGSSGGSGDAMDVDAVPLAAGGTDAGGAWVVQLLREGLSACSLEMAAAWAAAVRYALGVLMPPAALAAADVANGRAAAAALRGPPPRAATAGLRATLAALLAVPGGGGGAPVLLELKRLRLFESTVAAVRTYEPDCVPAAGSSDGGGGVPGPGCFAAAYGPGLGGSDADGRGTFVAGFRPPKEARAFLAGVMGEVALLMEAKEQPSAVQVRPRRQRGPAAGGGRRAPVRPRGDPAPRPSHLAAPVPANPRSPKPRIPAPTTPHNPHRS